MPFLKCEFSLKVLSLYEDYTGCLGKLASDAGFEDARSAMNDVGGALYSMRKHIWGLINREATTASIRILSSTVSKSLSTTLYRVGTPFL